MRILEIVALSAVKGLQEITETFRLGSLSASVPLHPLIRIVSREKIHMGDFANKGSSQVSYSHTSSQHSLPALKGVTLIWQRYLFGEEVVPIGIFYTGVYHRNVKYVDSDGEIHFSYSMNISTTARRGRGGSYLVKE